jgi:hypothetical protein
MLLLNVDFDHLRTQGAAAVREPVKPSVYPPLVPMTHYGNHGLESLFWACALAYVTIDLDVGAACKPLCLNFKAEL